MTDRRPTPDDLERLLLGASRRYTREQLAEAVGLTPAEVSAFWRALGFPDAGDEAAAFTVWDLEALRGVLELVESGVVDQPTAIQMVRALGRMTGRLAEWHAETLAEIVEESVAGRSGQSRLTFAYQLAQQLLPEFERLLIYAWRRKLASSANRLVAIAEVGESPLLYADASVGFADLVSFTRLSRGLSMEALGDLVEQFEAMSNDVIFGQGGRVVKTLGDEVVFVADTPATAAAIGCELVDQIGLNPELPNIRVGIATGPVVARLGDVFGTPANLAARLTSVAERNTVLVDAVTAKALETEPSVALRALPPTTVRGFGAVEVYTVSPRR